MEEKDLHVQPAMKIALLFVPNSPEDQRVMLYGSLIKPRYEFWIHKALEKCITLSCRQLFTFLEISTNYIVRPSRGQKTEHRTSNEHVL